MNAAALFPFLSDSRTLLTFYRSSFSLLVVGLKNDQEMVCLMTFISHFR